MAGEALDVFISYSHRDEGLKDELVNYHLKPLQRQGKINTWEDRQIEAGAEWATEIKTNLEKADIVLLLITRHFLASDYCYEIEMQRAVQRHHEGTARVIPIILGTCGWQYSPFRQLQVLPKDGKPVNRWQDRAEAFFYVEEGIRRVVDALNAERQEAAAAQSRQAEELKRQQEEAARLERARQERERLAAEQRQREAEAQRKEQERLEQARLAAEQRQREAEVQRHEQERQQQTARSTSFPQLSLPLKAFEFEVVTLNERGQEQTRDRKQVKYFSEDLGNGTGLDMLAIPGGRFLMGSPDGDGYANEKSQHQVTLNPFYMGKFAVTQAQWQAVAALPTVTRQLKPDPSRFKGAMRPVEQVSWDDAVEFCQRLSRYTKRDYRLPSEAEWEYACRAGTTTRFHFGDIITGEYVNCNCQKTVVISEGILGIGRKEETRGIYRQQTIEVGGLPPNAFGLYDMHGNIWEWCQDVWHDNYDGAPTDGSAWLEGGNQGLRVLRGASWCGYPEFCRSALRIRLAPDFINFDVGFRVVCVVAG